MTTAHQTRVQERDKHHMQLIFCVIWYSPLCCEVIIAFTSPWSKSPPPFVLGAGNSSGFWHVHRGPPLHLRFSLRYVYYYA